MGVGRARQHEAGWCFPGEACLSAVHMHASVLHLLCCGPELNVSSSLVLLHLAALPAAQVRVGVSIHHSVQSVALDTLVEHRLGGDASRVRASQSLPRPGCNVPATVPGMLMCPAAGHYALCCQAASQPPASLLMGLLCRPWLAGRRTACACRYWRRQTSVRRGSFYLGCGRLVVLQGV